jgi:hypothetical protein
MALVLRIHFILIVSMQTFTRKGAKVNGYSRHNAIQWAVPVLFNPWYRRWCEMQTAAPSTSAAGPGVSATSIVDHGAKPPSAQASPVVATASTSTIKTEPHSDIELFIKEEPVSEVEPVGTAIVKNESESEVELVGTTIVKNESESDIELVGLPQPTSISDSDSDVPKAPAKMTSTSASVHVKSEPGAPFTPPRPRPRPNFTAVGKKRKAMASGYGSPILISSDSEVETKPAKNVPAPPAGPTKKKKKVSSSSSVISITSDSDENTKKPAKPIKPAKPAKSASQKTKRSSSVISISSGSDNPSKSSFSALPRGALPVKQEPNNNPITIVLTDSDGASNDTKALARRKKKSPPKEGIQITRQLVVDELKTLDAFPSSYDIPEDGRQIAYQIILKDSEEEYSKLKDRQGEPLTMLSRFRQSVNIYIFLFF